MALPLLAPVFASASAPGGFLSALVNNLFVGKRRREQEKLLKTQAQLQQQLYNAQLQSQKELLKEQRKNLLLQSYFTNYDNKKSVSPLVVVIVLIIIAILIWRHLGA